jgi:hypothetical protein
LPVTLRQDRGGFHRDELTAMLRGVVDHLWQSAWICGGIALLAFISRNTFAPLRLWMWRVAALKFVFPFSILVAIGEWLGFPVRYPDDPAPAALLETFDGVAHLGSPARMYEWSSWRLLLATLAASLLTVACIRWVRRQLRIEQKRMQEEERRLERDPDDIVRRPGFFNSALLALCAMLLVAMPLLAGAVEGRQKHFELLVSNARSLRNAAVSMTPAAAGMGTRYRVDADEEGVSIRNVTIQELAAIAYGVTRYYVRGDHFYEEGEQDWFIVPRYDVRVSGRVHEPDKFDPFALRASITRMLAERHGLEIYVNRECQPPCGKYGVPMPAAGL